MNETHAPDDVPADLARCPACALGWNNPMTAARQGGCALCDARAIAAGPPGWHALHADTEVELRRSVLRVFGEAQFDDGRRLVWRWLERIRQLKQEHTTC